MIRFVRNDLTTFADGVNGGKAICIDRLLKEAINQGYTEIVTAGSRTSPQIEIVSQMCEHLNLKCHVFVPKGQFTNILNHINDNYKNTTIHQSTATYTNTAKAQASNFAIDNNFYYIPFGCECIENIEEVYKVMQNTDLTAIHHIVVPIGSGTAFVGIINALNRLQRFDITVTGIRVGMSPEKTIERFMNPGNQIQYEIIKSDLDYKEFYPEPIIEDVELDPQYEAKCIPYLKDNDCLWIVGKRLVI